uniref:Uncharacterized protein n=1 Tax=Pavo cristatus TaxID=9049 RepID=A0A8C9LBB6_PAVCR
PLEIPRGFNPRIQPITPLNCTGLSMGPSPSCLSHLGCGNPRGRVSSRQHLKDGKCHPTPLSLLPSPKGTELWGLLSASWCNIFCSVLVPGVGFSRSVAGSGQALLQFALQCVGGVLLSVGWLQRCVARGTSQSIPLHHILQAEDGS